MAETQTQDTFTFTVGKLDAGMAILLGERAHLIEFPSVLLPPGAAAGSIVNISVHQNHAEEEKRDTEFWSLQEDIMGAFGQALPAHPELKMRNVTQTSVVLEWPPIDLATSTLRSLDIYRNGQRLTAVPNPKDTTSTRVSSLDLNVEYTFQLILRTTAGVFPSNILKVRTHSMTDTSGICVCFGNVEDPQLLEHTKATLEELGARWTEKMEIDTTHFVCTTPAATHDGAQVSGSNIKELGSLYEQALKLTIPIVQPTWILACYSEKRMLPVAPFYLGATPVKNVNALSLRHQSMSQASLVRSSPPNSNSPTSASNRSSLPPPARNSTGSRAGDESTFVNQHQPALEPMPEDSEPPSAPSAAPPVPEHSPRPTPVSDPNQEQQPMSPKSPLTQADRANRRKSRHGTMDRAFKFPDTATPPGAAADHTDSDVTPRASESPAAAPAVIEVPPPPPVEKERAVEPEEVVGDDELGETEDIPL